MKTGHFSCFALLAFALGCGGRATVDGAKSTGGDANGNRNAGNGGASANGGSMGTTVGGSGGGASGISVGGTSTIAMDAGSVVIADAGTTDANPGCGATMPCGATPADVHCTDETQCKILLVSGCSNSIFAFGVNTAANVKCEAPPCLPPDPGADAGCNGCATYQTQDCRTTNDADSLVAHCIDQRQATVAGCGLCDLK